jgi:dihydroorotate dehydrogenase (NAD+) catalytic subunit
VEFLLAGARAVQVGTATFADPNAAAIVHAGIRRYLEEYGETGVGEIVGKLETASNHG